MNAQVASGASQVVNGIFTHKKTDPFSNVFRKGLVIWRPCSFFGDGSPEIGDVGFVKTEKGSFMAKIAFSTAMDYCREPVVINHSIFGRENRGVTVFVAEEVPKNWTHLVVTGVSRLFKETSEKAETGSKGAVFAKVGVSYDFSDYLHFRRGMFHLNLRLMNAPIGEIAREYEQLWPEEERPGTLRCVTSPFYNDPVNLLECCHFEEIASVEA
jgi:hypothetical protein